VDFVLTDPPYITRYRERAGRQVAGDDTDDWLCPAVREVYRLLRSRSFCVSFYGWGRADLFLTAWRAAGFRPVGSPDLPETLRVQGRVFEKPTRGCLPAGKRRAPCRRPTHPGRVGLALYGNLLHPTRNGRRAYTAHRGVLPYRRFWCWIRSAAPGQRWWQPANSERDWFGIELDEGHHRTATERLGDVRNGRSGKANDCPAWHHYRLKELPLS